MQRLTLTPQEIKWAKKMIAYEDKCLIEDVTDKEVFERIKAYKRDNNVTLQEAVDAHIYHYLPC